MDQISNQKIEVEVPCCGSVRECKIRKLYVIGIRKTPRILRVINAVRCGHGVRKTVKIYLANDIVVVEHYISNRGKHYVRILWKPADMTEEQACQKAFQALGIDIEEVVM